MNELREYCAKTLLSEEEIKAMVARLGAQITKDYAGKKLFLICCLLYTSDAADERS